MKFNDISTTKIRQVQLVDRVGSEKNFLGTLHVTTSHLIFKADETNKEIWIAYGLIQTIEKLGATASGFRLSIKCKHFHAITLLVPKEKECQELYETLQACTKLLNINDCFAFSRRTTINSKKPDGTEEWSRLDWDREFQRQGVGEIWKKSDFNHAYNRCDTYPEDLWFPEKASTAMLLGSSKFRSRSRLPALTYYNRSNKAALVRCAQPLTGFSARCEEDEILMNLIYEANGSGKPLFLVDTRPRVNAMVNKVQGKGFEDVRNYTNMQFHFFDIENIHVMRSSQNKLVDACSKALPVSEYLKIIDSSGWLKHLRCLLECAKFIADALSQGISCVVHCSDGWDRTSQTVSLSQILLDPFYRTIRGFETLIDKDWLGFGFKFDDRCGHVTSINEDLSKEVSPIFTQFLDAVYQLMRQKPLDFEFNERFLLEINEHAYACVYGTFLGNCDKDRKDLRVNSRTQSLWNHFENHLDDYRNPFYTEGAVHLHDVNIRPYAFTVWTGLYNRFDNGIQPRENIDDAAITMKEHIQVLEKAIDNLMKGESLNVSVNPRWQPLLGADECTGKTCGREFASLFDRRNHCHGCGNIFCKRCITTTEDSQMKLCESCMKTAMHSV
uniref:phosphatidylinositol-3,5-bisphosphate 3-phosphatase n=1 Tax=Panagrellus redivivus TaxID=6233 RepID=A0A7E4W118_PANRE